MKRIITQEETLYELAADYESLNFWSELGFKVIRKGVQNGIYYLRKTCSFKLLQELGGLAIVRSNGMEGVANRWGCLILPCRFLRIELFASNEGESIQKLHFVGYKGEEMEIYEFCGEKPTKILALKQLSS